MAPGPGLQVTTQSTGQGQERPVEVLEGMETGTGMGGQAPAPASTLHPRAHVDLALLLDPAAGDAGLSSKLPPAASTRSLEATSTVSLSRASCRRPRRAVWEGENLCREGPQSLEGCLATEPRGPVKGRWPGKVARGGVEGKRRGEVGSH